MKLLQLINGQGRSIFRVAVRHCNYATQTKPETNRHDVSKDVHDNMMLDVVQPTRDTFHSSISGTMTAARSQDKMKAMGLVPDDSKWDPYHDFREETIEERLQHIGHRITGKEKNFILIQTLLELGDSKDEIYGALDAWVAYEDYFSFPALRYVLIILEKEGQWHRVVQVIKWILSKGQANTMGTYLRLIRALDMDYRAEEAHNFWVKKTRTNIISVPWQACHQMISVYYRNGMLQHLVKLFKRLEALGRKPPDKLIVHKVADAYELLGLTNDKDKLLKKYIDLLNRPTKKCDDKLSEILEKEIQHETYRNNREFKQPFLRKPRKHERESEASEQPDVQPWKHERESMQRLMQPWKYERESEQQVLQPWKHERESEQQVLQPWKHEREFKQPELKHERESHERVSRPLKHERESEQPVLQPWKHEREPKKPVLPVLKHERNSKQPVQQPWKHERESMKPVSQPAKHERESIQRVQRSWKYERESEQPVQQPSWMPKRESKFPILQPRKHERESKEPLLCKTWNRERESKQSVLQNPQENERESKLPLLQPWKWKHERDSKQSILQKTLQKPWNT